MIPDSGFFIHLDRKLLRKFLQYSKGKVGHVLVV